MHGNLFAMLRSFLLLLLMAALQVTAIAQQNNTSQLSAEKAVIADLGKIVNPKGIQESYTITIGGIQQWIYVRGQNRNNPVLLFVHGGPASPMSPDMWMFQRPIEEYFTVINWDQRASGKSCISPTEQPPVRVSALMLHRRINCHQNLKVALTN